jgi:CheY-like chemotaxis protein
MTSLGETTRRDRPEVLVVDDSIDMRDLLVEILGPAGYSVRAVASGPRAIQSMQAVRPDVVVMDLLMPGMSGFALRAEMLRRADLADIPVVVLSAYWHRPGETLEAVDALSKPFSINRLLEVLRRATAEAGASASDGQTPDDPHPVPSSTSVAGQRSPDSGAAAR